MQNYMNRPHLRITSTPEKDRTEERRKTFPVFYNVFTEPESDGSLTKSIVDEQMKRIRAFHQVFVRSIGKPIQIENATIQIENATILQHDDEDHEPQTLGLLYQHCVENPSDTVVYLHSKGSFHAKQENNRLRRFLTRGALSEECAHMPDQCNICSSRFSPLPHPHTSGNMWVAKCVYVRKLINPIEFQQKMEDIFKDGDSIKGIAPEVVDKIHPSAFGLGRYAAEHWINSHPSAVPCDLASDDYKYTWSYDGVPDEDFQIDLKTAPRFEEWVYQMGHHAVIDPLRIQQEYLALYNESTPKIGGVGIFTRAHIRGN